MIPVSYNCDEMFIKQPSSSCFQVVLVESGYATLRINSDRCFLQSSALIFRSPGTVIDKLYSHSLQAKSITFHPKFIGTQAPEGSTNQSDSGDFYSDFPSLNLFFNLSKANAGVLPLNPPICPKATALFNDAISEMMNQSDSLWYSRVRVSMIELFRLAEEEFTRYVCEEPPRASIARATLDYIHTNYEKEITVRMLCEMFHTNHTTLLRDFRQLTGTTIGQYILEYRLTLVREALIFTELTIEDIATKFGFKQASYLSRVFHSRVGLAPGQFRNRMKAAVFTPPEGFTDISFPNSSCFKNDYDSKKCKQK